MRPTTTLTGRAATAEPGSREITVTITGERTWTGGANQRTYFDVEMSSTDSRYGIHSLCRVDAGTYRAPYGAIVLTTSAAVFFAECGALVDSHPRQRALGAAVETLVPADELEEVAA